jgi:hypothetical protein
MRTGDRIIRKMMNGNMALPTFLRKGFDCDVLSHLLIRD